MSPYEQIAEVPGIALQWAASDGGFNGSIQHLNSKYREEDVVDEAATEDLLQHRTKSIDVGRIRFDIDTEDIEFIAGHWDMWNEGKQALCAALTP
jgi:hypothetical protein